MRTPTHAIRFALAFVALIVSVSRTARAAEEEPRFSLPRFWWRNWAVSPWIPLIGDADGDGRADLVAVGGEIEVERTSPLGKWAKDRENRTPFINDLAAAACACFRGGADDEVLGVGRDGAVWLASGMKRGASRYARVDQVGEIPASMVPPGVVRALSADIDHDGRIDALVPAADGWFLLLRNRPSGDGNPRFEPLRVDGAPRKAEEIQVGRFGADLRNRLVWIDAEQGLNSAPIEFAGGAARLGAAVHLITLERGEHLAVGRFLGQEAHDIVAGRRFLPGGDPARTMALDALPEARDEAWLLAGDFNGDGRDDLVRKQNRLDREGGAAVFIHFSNGAEGEHCAFLDDDNDGLPDDWENGLVRPGGINLKELGCKTGRCDVIVEIERFDNVDVPLLKTEVEITVRYFASLPVKNPDGSHGIAMHIVYRPPTPHADFEQTVEQFDDRYPPREHRGVVHSMFCGAEGDPGFAVAMLLGDHGKFLLNPIVHDVISHEFGHELGLPHYAFQAHNSPIYMSVMNYTYIRGPGGHLDLARYSEGSLCSLVLNERKLSERLPFPFEKVSFLAMGPYQYRLARGPDHTTLIDWNWNGILGEENIVADINYDHGTDAGPLYDLGQTDAAPVLVVHGSPATGRLLLFYGRGGGLRLRQWLGDNVDTHGDRWSADVPVEDAGVVGDATAAYVAGAVWAAYRTAEHVAVRRIMPGGEQPSVGSAILVPKSEGAEPTLAAFRGQLALLLWRSPDNPIGLRLIDVDGEQLKFGEEEKSNFASQTPVAAVEAGADKHSELWVGFVEPADPAHRFWSQVRRFAPGRGGHWRETRREWVDGQRARLEGADHFATHVRRRMTLLWRPEPGFGANGRLYHFSGSETSDRQPWSAQYITMQAARRETFAGWYARRYSGLFSASAPGACWFRDDIAYALRLHDDKPENDNRLKVGFYGSGALPEPMSDFDDVGFIRRVGLSHSISAVTPELEAATPNLPDPAQPTLSD